MAEIQMQDLQPLLSVFDMAEAVGFYCEVLGFTIESRSPTYATENGVEMYHWCTIKSGDVRLMLNTEYDEGERPAERPRSTEDPFGVRLYLGCSNIDAIYERLKAACLACKPPNRVSYGSRYTFRVLSFRDPDGHGITLQWPTDPA